MMISIFATSVIDGHIYIWLVFLSHCVLMLLLFRPQREDTNKSKNKRNFFLTFSLVFTQIFTFIPFKRDPSKRLLYTVFYYTVLKLYLIKCHFIIICCCFSKDLFTRKFCIANSMGSYCIQSSASVLAIYSYRSTSIVHYRIYSIGLLF